MAKKKHHSAPPVVFLPAAALCESRCFAGWKADTTPSYLQIRFIESILNTAGAAKSPIYHKHLISSGSERLELAFRAPELVASFLQFQAHAWRLMPRLRQWTIQMYLCCSSRCHLLPADCVSWVQTLWDCMTRFGVWMQMRWRGDLSCVMIQREKQIQE